MITKNEYRYCVCASFTWRENTEKEREGRKPRAKSQHDFLLFQKLIAWYDGTVATSIITLDIHI